MKTRVARNVLSIRFEMEGKRVRPTRAEVERILDYLNVPREGVVLGIQLHPYMGKVLMNRETEVKVFCNEDRVRVGPGVWTKWVRAGDNSIVKVAVRGLDLHAVTKQKCASHHGFFGLNVPL